MKKLCLLLAFAGIGLANAQNEVLIKKIPVTNVKTMTGEIVSTDTLSNNGKPMIIDFWATWCKPFIEELNAIHDVYADWQKETGVKMVIISVDDSRTTTRVAPFYNGKGWYYESYLDPNSDFKRSMNVNMPPHTFLVNGKGEVVWQHVGFAEGNEEEIYEVIKKLSADNPKN